MGSLLIGQSGGPTSVINSSLIGAVKQALKEGKIDNIYGALYGISGVLSENFLNLKEYENELDTLAHTPAALLGSVRFMLPEPTIGNETYEKIISVFKKYNIEYFFYIGGNDSMDTCNKLNVYFQKVSFKCKVIGIPKTIDNDLVLTDHCPGYGSAAKYVATTLMEIYQDIQVYEKGRITIVEIMGRDAGWLTAASKLTRINDEGVDLIYLPEVPFDMSEFLNSVKTIYQKNKKVLVAVSEGIRDQNGEYILKYRSFNNNDSFGHLQLGGVSLVLCKIINEQLGLSTRAIELNLPQRCASHLTSLTDFKEAANCGKWAVKYALKGKTGVMISMNRISDYKIKYDCVPLSKVASFVKGFPTEWIINNNDISDEYLSYALPLIKGETGPKFYQGLPVHKKIKR